MFFFYGAWRHMGAAQKLNLPVLPEQAWVRGGRFDRSLKGVYSVELLWSFEVIFNADHRHPGIMILYLRWFMDLSSIQAGLFLLFISEVALRGIHKINSKVASWLSNSSWHLRHAWQLELQHFISMVVFNRIALEHSRTLESNAWTYFDSSCIHIWELVCVDILQIQLIWYIWMLPLPVLDI